MREIMPEVKIEALTFPKEDIERIEFGQNDDIRIHLSDRTLVNNKKFMKWINICGTMDKTIVEDVSIGRNHFSGKKFRFECSVSIGLPGKTACNIDIRLNLVKA